MNGKPTTIPAAPATGPATDFFALRREGIGYIEQLSGGLWTDYNAHDPGITILEQLCYVLTDLAHRAQWNIEDLLTPDPNAGIAPYLDQTFFTAADILTVNPVTPDDYRRLLIGMETVRNAWLYCRRCACDVVYYAYRRRDVYTFAFAPPGDATEVRCVDIQGMNDVLLELEADDQAGDLNDGKLEITTRMSVADGSVHTLVLELRLPARPDDWAALAGDKALDAVTLTALGAARGYDVFTDGALDDTGRQRYLQTHWNHLWFASLRITLAGTPSFEIHDVALHLFGDNVTRVSTTPDMLRDVLQDGTGSGAVATYRTKARRIDSAVRAARTLLAAHRNLAEDFCHVSTVRIEDVAVCADIEVTPDADIERIQAQAWFRIARHFNPPVPQYGVQEMLDGGLPVESIFEGPRPHGGFVRQDELDAAQLRTVLYTSDLIRILMEIDGVVAVGSLLLSAYDDEGAIIAGASDPTLVNGNPVFDPARTSAAWQLHLQPLHQPRLYRRRTRFLFFKNGLPFSPRMDEAQDTLLQLEGEPRQLGRADAQLDLPVLAGTWRNAASYYPLQYELPRNYGLSPQGLPADATPLRRAQAHQLQAYLTVFEQLLANAGEQLAHVADLFSTDAGIDRTYFAHSLKLVLGQVYEDVVDPATESELAAMLESATGFEARRNRFLDHLLARFGERFEDHVLLLTDTHGVSVEPSRQIADKIALLRALPRLGHDRAKAFDYTRDPDAPDNMAGVQQRISLLLGESGATMARAIVVEHVLLRPRFIGDALMQPGDPGGCDDCMDADPYSFRLSIVIPGREGPTAENLAMRAFAASTLCAELPAHLLARICWVDADAYAAFSLAWHAWLEASARADWEQPSIPEQVRAMLRAGLDGPGNASVLATVRRHADDIVRKWGAAFSSWMQDNLDAGRELADLTAFDPEPVAPGADLPYAPDTAARMQALLQDRYARYVEVSYRLHRLIRLLAALRNVYPPATLHDCDDGGDINPVRLGGTVLGADDE